MPSSRTPSRASSHRSLPRRSADSSTNLAATALRSDTTNDALIGASLAFSRSPSLQPPPTRASISSLKSAASHGATSSALRGGSSVVSHSTHNPTKLPVGGADRGRGGSNIMERPVTLDMANMPRLVPPSRDASAAQSTSPSQHAAVAVTTRAYPPAAEPSAGEHRGRARAVTSSKQPAIAPKPRTLSGHFNKPDADATDKLTDTASTAPTTSLVNLFEQRSREAQQGEKKLEPHIIKLNEDLALKSPKPVRSGITSMFQLELSDKSHSQELGKERIDSRQSTLQGSQKNGHFSPDEDDHNVQGQVVSSPYDISNGAANTASPSSGHAYVVESDSGGRPTESPLSLRQPATEPVQIKQPPRPTSAHPHGLSISQSPSLTTIPAQFHQAYPRRMTPLTTGDDLANAIVASSLASSRAASPTRLNIPAPKKKNPSRLPFSRTPSPAKGGMLHTLRKEDSSSESEDDHHPYGKHRKKRLVRKHPNKHHEGDRKRWRDAVTERERKRYEGVWAANKGLHYSFTFDEQKFFQRAPMHQRTLQTKAMVHEQVSNIVAREVWNRSRLPETVLELVWDLVDSNGLGRLQKEEFVVGMWLIDQRLKGRKLPVKVSETVWASVRGLQGIKIRK